MPQQLSQLFQRHLLRRRFFLPQEPIIVAVSTGVDSMTLLDLLMTLPVKQRPRIIIAHVNHHLRTQSSIEEQFIRQFAKQHQLTIYVGQWQKSSHPATGIEEAGRNFRYNFFRQIMKKTGAKVIMTAHHGNDQAETVLMKLVRGDNIRDLTGIAESQPFADGELIRPLLGFSKKQIVDYARKKHLTWFEDATNDSLSITRNRFRHQYLPELSKENVRVEQHLTRFATELSDILTVSDLYCQHLAKQIIVTKGQSNHQLLDLNKWQELAIETKRVFLSWWANANGVNRLGANQLDELVGMLENRKRPQAAVKLPCHLLLKKNYRWAFFSKIQQNLNNSTHLTKNVVELGAWYPIGNDQEIAVLEEDDKVRLQVNTQQFEMWLAPEQFPLSLRLATNGDRLRLKNGHLQKVSRILIDKRVPHSQRANQVVLVDQSGIVVWLPGYKLSWFTRPKNYKSKWHHVFLCRRQIKGRA